MTPKRTLRYYFIKFKRLQGDPVSLARGIAIGIYLGIVPIAPLHTIMIVLVTFLTRTSTVAALLACVAVCNPFTYIPQYYLSIVIGNAVTPLHLDWQRMEEILNILANKPGIAESLGILWNLGLEAAAILIIGGTVLALPFTIGAYIFSLRFFINLREKKRRRHILT